MNKLFLNRISLLEKLILFLFFAMCVSTFAELEVDGPIFIESICAGSVNTTQVCDKNGENCVIPGSINTV